MFRFTIRELVLLTLVVAMGVGWWLDRQSWQNDLTSLEKERDQLALEKSKSEIRAEEAWRILQHATDQLHSP